MRFILIALLTPLFSLGSPASGAPLPQGEFLLGTYIWPEKALPRYLRLRIEGERIELHFFSPSALDWQACDETGDCQATALGGVANAQLISGLVSLAEIEIDQSAPLDPMMPEHFGKPAHEVYTEAVMDALSGAVYSETVHGFRVTGRENALDFYAVPPDSWDLFNGYAEAMAQSIVSMAFCDVRALAPILNNPAPSAQVQRFIHALEVMRTGWQTHLEGRRVAPYKAELTAAQEAEAKQLQLTRVLPGLLASLTPEGQDLDPEQFWADTGHKIYKQDRAAFEADLARYGPGLADWMAFNRYLAQTRTSSPKVAEVCADPSLGFLDEG